MQRRPFFASLTRIADLERRPMTIAPLPRADWGRGDYVLGEVIGPLSTLYRIELTNGRMTEMTVGDTVIGALGDRYATLEATGSWVDIDDSKQMELLTGAGLFGKCRSKSVFLPPLVRLKYRGHVLQHGVKRSMRDYRVDLPEGPYTTPTILLIGSSMSAGKTTTARILIRLLKAMDLRVVGTKLTGAGRYRDIIAMQDAGADAIFDFVDLGEPSTIGTAQAMRPVIRQVLARMSREAADVAVIEAGASPLEPYNSGVAVDELGAAVCLTILCASDPYAVLGTTTAFGHPPDLVTGIATNTDAGIALIEKLTGFYALNILDHATWPALTRLLEDKVLTRLREDGVGV